MINQRSTGKRDPRRGQPSAEERRKTNKPYKDTQPPKERKDDEGTHSDPRVREQFGQEISFLHPHS
jgi:hypothetical protein